MPKVLILHHPAEKKAAEELRRHCVAFVSQAAGDIVLATTTKDADATLVVVLIESRLLDEGGASVRDAKEREPLGFLPVLLRSVNLPDYLDGFQVLPASKKPVMQARSRDEVWCEVAQAIMIALGKISAPQESRAPLMRPSRVFVGREEMRSLCSERLASDKSVSLWGAPGVGKSTLALQALHDPRVVARFGERRYFIGCGSLPKGGDLLAHLAREMGMPSGALPKQWIEKMVSEKPHLVALDEIDAALDGQVLKDLLSHAKLTLLLTHRCATELDVFTREVKPLNLAASRELFITEAGPDFTDAPELKAILEMTDGLPLAVMLKGREARAQPLTTVPERLRRGEQEKSLAAAIQGSIDRLEEDMMDGLCLLAQLPAGMLPDDVKALGLDHAVQKLSAAALASWEDPSGRIRMLTPIRHHVRSQQKDKLVPERLRQLRQHYFTRAAEKEPDLDNLESLIGDALETDQLDEAIPAALKLAPFWRFTGLGNPALLEMASSKATAHVRWGDAAQCLARRADVALERTSYDAAQQWYKQAQTLFAQAGDESGGAWCHLGLGHICRYRCDARGALDHYRHAMDVYQHRQDPQGLAHAHKALGHQHLALREFLTADHNYREALRLFQETKDQCEAANCLRSLGLLIIKQGGARAAEPLLTEASMILAREGDIRGQADCLHALSAAALRRGWLEQAERLLHEARQGYDRIQDPRGQAQSLLLRARIHERRHDERAAQDYQEALQLAERLRSWRSVADAHEGLARHHRKAARHARAKIKRPPPAAAAASPPRS